MAVTVTDGVLSWRRVTPEDFPLLGRWLAEPVVARWWNHETSPEAVERDFGPTVRGEEPSEDLIAMLDGRPFGLVQRCRLHAYPVEHAEFLAHVDVPDEAMSLDYLIGEPGLIGRGLGTRMIVSALEATWATFPDAPCVIIGVAAANVASWRMLEKAGFTRIGMIELEPDNPIDDRWHVVSRIDRPACLRCGAPRDPADPTWVAEPDPGGGTRWLCPACVRRHVRDIEAKLSPEWW